MEAKTFDSTSMPSSAASFRTHRLVAIGTLRVEIKPTLGSWLFWVVVILLVVVPGLRSFMKDWIYWLLTSPFTLVVLFIMLRTKSYIFDRAEGRFWIKRILPSKNDPSIKLHNIAAVQFLTGHSAENVAAELNLCLQDGSRFHLVTRNEEKTLRVEAEALAVFLKVPLVTMNSSLSAEQG